MPRFQTILVPLDFSEHGQAALDLAIELAGESQATIHLVHAYELPSSAALAYGVTIPQAVWDGIRDAARERLDEQVKRVEAAGVAVKAHLLTSPPAEAIQEIARSENADVIVMGTRGLTGLKHVLLGSVAERTLRTSPCPVLTIKAHND